ncbi:hypothetical protein QFC22_002973 [Naganishia vaughanmartiniae]|uniref:Uncharacterized protein n=1 Tax=Naganishia vaughanmartiniae TaxID=1424756 RepID=A0ACC2X9K7_9TREE|nr:hypothetical protein QFC22_002973 [Naganishia vaughanmartiniae]
MPDKHESCCSFSETSYAASETFEETKNLAAQTVDHSSSKITTAYSNSDGAWFPTSKFYLLAASPVLRQKLAESFNSVQNGDLFLDERSDDLEVFLKIITHKAGPLHQFRPTSQQSLRLYKMGKRYAVEECFSLWINTALRRFNEQYSLETFAAACEQKVMDLSLAVESTRNFGKGALEIRNEEKRLDYLRRFDPTEWDAGYVRRCGTVAYSSYVNAFVKLDVSPGLRASSTASMTKKLMEEVFQMWLAQVRKDNSIQHPETVM